MKKSLFYIYYIGVLPFRFVTKSIALAMTFSILFLTISFAIVFNLTLDSDIFKVTLADLHAIESWKPVDNTKVYDKNGRLIAEKYNDYHIYTPFNKIPKKLIEIIISVEDKKFWNHSGIDLYSIVRAASQLIGSKGPRQGASTITQQVIKNLVLSSEKTIYRKVREIVLAIYLETFISKEKILEIYCNALFLGNGAYGVSAAAKRYFNLNINDLSTGQMAFIVGLFQSPSRYNPYKYYERSMNRRDLVLESLKNDRIINRNEFLKAKKTRISFYKREQRENKSPYFVDYVLEEAKQILDEKKLNGKGLKIYTSLDLNLSVAAKESMDESKSIFHNLEKSLKSKDEVQGAVLVIDRKTGNILAMQGGRDYKDSQFNRASKSLRAPGSAFKPFVYLMAIENGAKWNDPFYVAPVTIGNYRPRTQLSLLNTETTLFESFYKSINSTAVLLGQRVGLENIIKYAGDIGVKTPLKEEAATFLGSSGVSMLDMGRAYMTIANSGKRMNLSSIIRIEDMNGKTLYENHKKSYKRVLKKESYSLIHEGLKSVVNYGTGYKLRHLSGHVAGKTGTSNNSSDNWFCGYTDDLVIISWIGSEKMSGFHSSVSASNSATVLWGKLAQKSISILKTKRLSSDPNLEKVKVHPKYGHISNEGVVMSFIKGQAPTQKISDLDLVDKGEKLRIGIDEF